MTTYRLNGREVSRAEFMAGAEVPPPTKREPQRGRRFKTPGLFGDKTEWRFENGGKGRWCPQMGKKRSKDAYFHSRSALIETAKRKGLVVDQSN